MSQPRLIEISVAFNPPLSSLQQFRDAGRRYTRDGGIITAIGKGGATVVTALEPGDLPALKPGRVTAKIGASNETIVRTRVLK